MALLSSLGIITGQGMNSKRALASNSEFSEGVLCSQGFLASKCKSFKNTFLCVTFSFQLHHLFPKLYNQVRSLGPFRSSDLSLENIQTGFVTLQEFLLRKSNRQYYVLRYVEIILKVNKLPKFTIQKKAEMKTNPIRNTLLTQLVQLLLLQLGAAAAAAVARPLLLLWLGRLQVNIWCRCSSGCSKASLQNSKIQYFKNDVSNLNRKRTFLSQI